MVFKLTLNLIVFLSCLFVLQSGSPEYDKLADDQKNTNQKLDSSRNAYRDSLKISYIGNMGVLIGCDDRHILIDALHKKYKPDYVFPSKGTVQKLINGDSGIDIALVTHHHKDHFDAVLVSDYLKENDRSIVLGSPQVTEAIAPNSKEISFSNRIKEIAYDGEMHTILHDEIEIRAFKCPHVNATRHRSVQNIAYIIKIRGYSVLHVGDTNWDTARSSFKAQNVIDEKFDAVVLPYWMLLDKSSQKEVLESLTTKQIIATHIPPFLDDAEKKALLANHANIVLFDVLGKQITL